MHPDRSETPSIGSSQVRAERLRTKAGKLPNIRQTAAIQLNRTYIHRSSTFRNGNFLSIARD